MKNANPNRITLISFDNSRMKTSAWKLRKCDQALAPQAGHHFILIREFQ
jgi:hypothetical protein